MRKVYVVASYGRPIAALDEPADAIALADAIYGDDAAEHVHEVLHMDSCRRETIIVGSSFHGKDDDDGE